MSYVNTEIPGKKREERETTGKNNGLCTAAFAFCNGR
jgi:hypothetical protein